MLLQKRLNGYVEGCLNHFNRQVRSSKRVYLGWCDAKAGPSGSERSIRGIHTVSGDPQRCAKAQMESSTAQPPQPTLDSAGAAYVAALNKLVPLLTTANTYYERENYRDDGMAQGKALHPQIMDAYAAFEAANKSLSAEVERLQDEVYQRELDRCAGLPRKTLDCHVKNVIVASKRVIRGGTVEGGWEKIAADPFIRDVTTLEAAVDAMAAHSKASPQETDEMSSFGSFLDGSQEYVVAAKQLMRRVRDRTPYERGEKRHVGTLSEERIDGSPGKLAFVYNDLVDYYNSLNF